MGENNQKFENEYYNKRASEYEKIYFRDDKARRAEIDDEVKRLQELANGKVVTELACGTGYWTSRVSETASKIITSDLSLEMIAEAKKKNYHCPIQFTQSDLHNPPIEKNSVELLILGFWFSHEPKQNYDSFFNILRDLLIPNGKIWMIDNNPPAEGSGHDSIGSDKFGNNLKKRYLDNGTEFTIIKNYFNKEQLSVLFSKHFKIESLIHKKYYWSTVLTAK